MTLTVQSNGSGGYRLGINTEDSRDIFKCRKIRVRLFLPDKRKIVCLTACGNPCDKNGNWVAVNPVTLSPYRKKGYDLNKKELSEWIKENSMVPPKKLIFKLSHNGKEIHLRYIPKKDDLQSM